ncbi:DUF1697 domain-containing protein [Microbacterium hydrocarbonoxydans]|uniref:DUF1697 domain-containing protein n=1 Tax=Microbacterium hydrocarbonoxydans TaxID=273678 RepID=UPI00203CB95E|nr:DUF1697 domain-containing protein [Microbacterium hydrocarbonoxydans]MCM3780025.1 DUF1697 domain-containing protein [Microbacterium hydrocarbonoxydans]
MTRSVLLLRAVNVGGRAKVPMARLREVLTPELGDDVSTYIASGNVICETPSAAEAVCARVRAIIGEEFDVDTPVIHRTHRELAAAASTHPFPDASEKMLHAMFLEGDASDGAEAALTERLVPGERIALVGRELWIDYGEGGVQNTRLTKAVLDRGLGVAGTARNLRTVRTLVELTA